MGRVVEQLATLSTGASAAGYVYGPFSLLRHVETGDGSVGTDINYDFLGRQSYLKRGHVGSTTTEYNAFGDVVSATRRDISDQEVETTHYVRDLLGRPVDIWSRDARPPGIHRAIYWDTATNGSAVPGGIGKPQRRRIGFGAPDGVCSNAGLNKGAARWRPPARARTLTVYFGVFGWP